MSAQTLAVKDANNATQNLSVNQDATNGNALVGATSITDPSTGNKANVVQFHNADNQALGGSAYALNTGGVAQILNAAGNLDRQRETGSDNAPAQGITSGASNLALVWKSSIAGSISTGSQTVTPAVMSGTVGGVPWSIQTGGTVTLGSGATKETVVVTSVSSTTFTAVFAFSHAGPTTITGPVFNQARDAAGEADGASGIGTAVAAEYEYNGGSPGGGNFDRARSIQAKGRTVATISSGGGQGSSSFVVAAAGTLKAGMQLLAYVNASNLGTGTFETVYVDMSYVEGSTTVPLSSATLLANTYDRISYDSFAAMGPGTAGFQAAGMGVEEEALYDPVTNLFYLGRTATADAMAGTNVPAEGVALYNGATMDRARSAPGAIGVTAVSSDGSKATFRYFSAGNTPAATPTDIFTLTGSGTKTVRIKKIVLSGLATTAGQMVWNLIRRSAVNTGGTSTAPTAMKHDTSDGAATAVMALYTVNPAGLGTAVGTVRGGRLFHALATAQNDRLVFDFSTNQDKALILRGVTDILAINGGGAALPAGATLDIEIEFEEDNS